MSKTLTILIPSMKVQSSVRLIFPRLWTANKELVVGTFKQQVLPHIDLSNRILIRWGSYYETAGIAGSVDYNSRKSVIQATNKRLSRQMLAEAGVNVPRLVTPDSGDISYPLIARPEFHSLGKHFIIVKHQNGFIRHYGKMEDKWH